jgi:hypothetical protein
MPQDHSISCTWPLACRLLGLLGRDKIESSQTKAIFVLQPGNYIGRVLSQAVKDLPANISRALLPEYSPISSRNAPQVSTGFGICEFVGRMVSLGPDI